MGATARPDAAEERWCAQRRREVSEYLARERLTHGMIGDWPAWHVYPHVSIWAVESVANPGSVGWWVICGDLPTDYVSAAGLKDPRSAAGAIAQQWLRVVAYLVRGEKPPDVSIGRPESYRELAPLLQSRADLLANWVADDEVW
jgi:hypothetical protein